MDQLTTVGIDLAKDVFAICVLDTTGAVLQRRVLRREAFIRWAEQLSPCRVAMEACGSSHHWGRWFAARGHTARRMMQPMLRPSPLRRGSRRCVL
jgi:transposase